MDTVVTAANDLSKVCENWDVLSKLLREQFPLLTKLDLAFEEGKEDELLNRIQARLYKGREEVVLIIKKWSTHKEHNELAEHG